MTGPFDQPIVLASGNPKKLAEMREILGAIGLEIVGLNELNLDLAEPEETGTTFAENARIKAVSYAMQTGRTCLADDSGLVVDALAGEPGVYSARYSADEHTGDLPRADRDRLNNEKLLRELGDIPLEERSARFVCAMCLASPILGSSGGGFQPPRQTSPQRALQITEKGDLPHWRLRGATYFVTFNLHAGTLSDDERKFVFDACLHYHGYKFILHALTVMPDHVHFIARMLNAPDGSEYELSSLLHCIKSFSANQINLLRGEKGQVWQRESYDRIMSDSKELEETIAYIELNPVRQNLVHNPGEYAWSLNQIELQRRLDASATASGIQIPAETQGTFEGLIGQPGEVPRGSNGFGYDPLFLVKPDLQRTSAELSSDEKHALSHRGKASRLMADRIKELGQPS